MSDTDYTALLALIARIREASGDYGLRMQKDLVSYIGELKQKADILDAMFTTKDGVRVHPGDKVILTHSDSIPITCEVGNLPLVYGNNPITETLSPGNSSR